MTLHNAIYQILLESDRPMTAKELVDVINSRSLYMRRDKAPISPSQITARISQHPEEFDYIQGEIILTQNSFWGEIMRNHNYLQDLLSNLPSGEKGTLSVFLFFYKRISDLSEYKSEYNLPTQGRIGDLKNSLIFSSASNVLDDLIYGIKYLEKEFPQLKEFFIKQYELFRSLNNKIIFEIIITLSQFETSRLEDRKFGRIFEYLIQKSFNSSEDEYYFTPQPISELFSNLVDLENDSDIYDPCAGLGGIFTEINKKADNKQIRYFCSDINARVSSLGSLNLILNGIREFSYKSEDCLLNPFNLKFDIIISDLPLISKINDFNDLSFIYKLGLTSPTRNSGIAVFILFILSKLKKGGKAFLTVPDGFLFKKGYDAITRKYIVDNGFLEAVISLPPNALSPYTSVKATILCFSSGNNKDIKFINGGESFSQSGELVKESSLEDIVRAYKRSDLVSRITSIVPISSVSQNEYLLSVEQYNEIYQETGRLLEEGNAKKLDSLVKIQSGTSLINISEDLDDELIGLSSNSKIYIIKAENLKKDILDLKLVKEDVRSFIRVDKGVTKSILNYKCLLIARIGENPKPTIFDPTDFDKPVAIHRGVYALVPNDNTQISVEYLYYQFYSPYVQQQLTSSKKGATIPHLSISNLAKLVIPIVNYKEQNKLVSSQRANLIQLEKEKIEKRLKMLGYEREVADKESDIVRILVHQLRPTFLSLNSQVEVIMRIVQKNNLGNNKEFNDQIPDFSDPELLSLGIVPNKPSNYSLHDICNKLLKDSKDINDKLTYVNKVMTFNLNNDDYQDTLIKNFIENHINVLKVNNPLNFKIEITGEECLVELNKESISELIDQLINNAHTHAFDQGIGNNLLRFNIKKNKKAPTVFVEYSNNGKEFKLTLEQFVSPFQKSQSSKGTGIGGYYIKRIVETHQGNLALIEKIKKGFGLIIELPITKKINNDE
ncbi:MAG: N-6 DNA methylase [Leadbetterella sp.]|nr:N-6 DNA methylase [Leadbetterella sp.]